MPILSLLTILILVCIKNVLNSQSPQSGFELHKPLALQNKLFMILQMEGYMEI